MSTVSQSSYNPLVDPNDPNGVFQSGQKYQDGTLVSATINEKEANKYILDNFSAFDKDGNGALTQTEISQRLDAIGIENKVENIFTGETLSNNLHEQIYEKYIASADLDKNGEVTAQELYTTGEVIDNPQPNPIEIEIDPEKLEAARKQLAEIVFQPFNNENGLDTNGDLFIDEKEALAAGGTKDDFKQMLANTDLDGNNKMSFGEYCNTLNNGKDIDLKEFSQTYGSDAAKTLSQYDLNNDGKVTQDEIKSYDKQMDKSNDSIIDKFKNLSTEAKVGIIITGIVVIAAIVALIVALATKKDKKKEANTQLNIQQQIPTGQPGMIPQAYMMPMQPQMYCMPQPYMIPQANYGYNYQNVGYNVSNNLNSINQAQGRQM